MNTKINNDMVGGRVVGLTKYLASSRLFSPPPSHKAMVSSAKLWGLKAVEQGEGDVV